MSLIRRTVEALGADHRQWRTLTGVMLKVDMRSASAMQLGDRRQKDGVGWSFVAVHGLAGIVAAVMVAAIPNLFSGAVIAMSIVMLLLASALLTDYQTVVASPLDYDVLGYQPVSSRTYFLSRLTNLLIYAGIIGLLIGGPSMVPMLVRYGLLATAGWLLGVLLAIVWIVLIVTTSYAAMIRFVPPDRLRRGLGYLQLLTSTMVYGSLFLLPLAIGEDVGNAILIEPGALLLLYPPAWFAGLSDLAAGSFAVIDGVSLLAVAGTTTALVLVARGRLSLAYAERLGAFLASGGTPGRRRRTRPRGQPAAALRWPVAVPGELRVMATLIRASFRYDMRFRMAALSAFPLSLCLLAAPLLLRHFGDAEETFDFQIMGIIHMATIMLPLGLLDNLRYSESYRASWLFFATPTDPARLTVQAGNCAGLFFLLPYLVLVAGMLCWIFEDVVRGISHAFLLGLSTLATMQLALLAMPWIPFSEPPPKGRQSARQVAFMIAATAVGFGVLPLLITFAISRPPTFAAMSGVLIVCCVLLQRVLAGRIRQRVEKIEFVG